MWDKGQGGHSGLEAEGQAESPALSPSLSGNPPFYEEADEDDYENHDKNLFRKILAGDYEFDPPYWDDISQAGEPHARDTHMGVPRYSPGW